MTNLKKLSDYIKAAERAIDSIGRPPSFSGGDLSPERVTDDVKYALGEVLDTVKVIKEILEGFNNGNGKFQATD